MDNLQNLEMTTASEIYALLLVYIQLKKSLQDRMTVTAILVSLVVLAGISMSNANTSFAYIVFNKFNVGRCIEASFTAPTTGATSIKLYDTDGLLVFGADYRKLWGYDPSTRRPWKNSFVFVDNFGRKQYVRHILTTPGTVMSLRICAEDTQYSIVFNQTEIAKHTYRAPVTNVDKAQFVTSGSDSVLKKLCLLY